MSDRMTSASAYAHGVSGVADYGRKTRAEMLQRYRDYYRRQIEEAEKALAVPEDEIVTETFLGLYAQKNREVVA